MKINIISDSNKKFETISQELTYIGLKFQILYNDIGDNHDFVIIDHDYRKYLQMYKKSKFRITISNIKDNFLAVKLYNYGSSCHFVWSQDSTASIAWAMYHLFRKPLIQLNKESLNKQNVSLFEMFKVSEISESHLSIIGNSKNFNLDKKALSKLLADIDKLDLTKDDIVYDESQKYPYQHKLLINSNFDKDVLFLHKNKTKSRNLPNIIELSKDLIGNLKIAICSNNPKYQNKKFDFYQNLDFLKYTHYDYVLFDAHETETHFLEERNDIILFNFNGLTFEDVVANFKCNLYETDHSTIFLHNIISIEKYFSYGFGFTSLEDFNLDSKFYVDKYQSFVKVFKKIKLPLVNKFYYEGFLENSVYSDRLSLLQDIHKAKVR